MIEHGSRPEIVKTTEGVTKKRGTILIVDDDHLSLTILGNLLRDDYELMVATSGEAALRLMAEAVPDLILLDIVMPGIDGYEVCRRIIQMPGHSHTPIIFITTLANEDDALKGFENGAVDFIHKPFSRENVRVRVDLHIELKRNRDLLEEALLKNRLILEAAAEGICGVDAKGRATFVNPAALRMLGFSEQEFIGSAHHQLIHHSKKDNTPYPPADCPILSTIQDGQVKQHDDEVFWRKDGSCFPVEYVVSPAPQSGGAVIVFKDISLRLKLELEVMRARNLESLGSLAGGIAHDFNNLFQGLLGNISLAEMYTPKESGAYQFLKNAEQAHAQATKLTSQLIAFSSGCTARRIDLQLPDFLQEAITSELKDSGLEAEYHLADDLWTVKVDPAQLRQVMNYMTINAIEAMPSAGKLRIMAVNEILSSAGEKSTNLVAGNYVKISIQDQGCGISPENLPRIFDPYFSTKQRGFQKGMGLGLSLCDTIISKHGGAITVESKPGHGTTFHVLIPAVGTTVAEKTAAKIAKSGDTGHRILIMDDDAGVVQVTTDLLTRYGFRVGSAMDGDTAIAAYQEAQESGDPYKVVILDLVIPVGKGGLEVIAILKKIDPEVKAIVSSGYADDQAMIDFADYGFMGACAKPYHFKEMKALLDRLI